MGQFRQLFDDLDRTGIYDVHRHRVIVRMSRDFLIGAIGFSLHQQLQNLFVAARNLDVAEILQSEWLPRVTSSIRRCKGLLIAALCCW